MRGHVLWPYAVAISIHHVPDNVHVDRLRIAPRHHQHHGVICIDDRGERVERQSSAELFQRLIKAVLRTKQSEGVKVAGRGGVGI